MVFSSDVYLDSRYGDDLTGKTASLCVRRAVYVDPETGKEDPAKKGVCSNYLCDAKPGDSVSLTGPAGKVMLLPEKTPEVDLIWVATGTGIAPYRSFALRLFKENTPAAKAFKGRSASPIDDLFFHIPSYSLEMRLSIKTFASLLTLF